MGASGREVSDMAKTNTPFLSLGSQGSVGDTLTSQKRGRDTILRRLPVPTDLYSLPQAYQRWLYQDYAYLWTLPYVKDSYAWMAQGTRLTSRDMFVKSYINAEPLVYPEP